MSDLWVTAEAGDCSTRTPSKPEDWGNLGVGPFWDLRARPEMIRHVVGC